MIKSIAVHSHFGQLERLIRSIWRPQERYTPKIWVQALVYIQWVHNKWVYTKDFLMILLYQKQHSICIHIDIKSDQKFYDALEKISNCFDNIFLAKKREDVIYTHFSMIKVSFSKTWPFNSVKNIRGKLIHFNWSRLYETDWTVPDPFQIKSTSLKLTELIQS